MLRTLSLVTLCLALLVPAATSQSLDGTWIKVNVAASGLVLAPDGSTSKAADKFTVYMNVVSASEVFAGGVTSYEYTFDLYSEVADGEWAQFSSGSFATPASETAMFGDADLGIAFELAVPALLGKVDSLAVRFVAKLKVKKDKEGNLKSATFKSLGGVIPSGTSEGESVIGGAKLSGKTIDPSKLPFALIG